MAIWRAGKDVVARSSGQDAMAKKKKKYIYAKTYPLGSCLCSNFIHLIVQTHPSSLHFLQGNSPLH